MKWLIAAVAAGLTFAGLKSASAKASVTDKHTFGGDVKLSKNFMTSEFLNSGVMPELKNYKLTGFELANLKRLVDGILQPVRDKFGPIIITAGGRPKTLKSKAGKTFYQLLKKAGYNPSETSQHIDFEAAGFHPRNRRKVLEVYKYILTLPAANQVILYMKNGQPHFIHASVVNFAKGPIPKKVAHLIDTNGKKMRYEA